MRIAHVTATFPPYYGGTGNVCYHNARVLAARGHDVHVFTADWPGERDDPPGVTVHRLKPMLRVGNAPVLPQLMRLRHFDMFHLHYPFIFGAETLCVSSWLCNTPMVLTYHNDMFADGARGVFFDLYQRSCATLILRKARRICGVSLEHAYSSSVIRRALRGDTRRIVELPNGVDTQLFHPDSDGESVRDVLGIPESSFVLAFVAALDSAHTFKRLDLLLKCVAALPDRQIHLIVVGGGDVKRQYEDLAIQLGIADRTYFVGAVPHSDLPPYLVASDTVVLPSDSVESFGLVLVEALACGIPVIASDLPGVRTLVEANSDGFLVRPGDRSDLTQAISRMDEMDRRCAKGNGPTRASQSRASV